MKVNHPLPLELSGCPLMGRKGGRTPESTQSPHTCTQGGAPSSARLSQAFHSRWAVYCTRVVMPDSRICFVDIGQFQKPACWPVSPQPPRLQRTEAFLASFQPPEALSLQTTQWNTLPPTHSAAGPHQQAHPRPAPTLGNQAPVPSPKPCPSWGQNS